MMPNLPFPNLEIVTKGGIAEIKLKNQDLAEMLKKAIESKGQKVTKVEVYPDVFVVVVDLTEFENKLRQQGFPATIEPKELKITIDRKELIDTFTKVTNLSELGVTIKDERDYILLSGRITGLPNVKM